jgi:hypothetical protein
MPSFAVCEKKVPNTRFRTREIKIGATIAMMKIKPLEPYLKSFPSRIATLRTLI